MVQYSIDPARLGTLANWSDDVATVHISSPGRPRWSSMRPQCGEWGEKEN